MKTTISPMFLTYYMVKWQDVEQRETEQKCQLCGGALKRTEEVVDGRGLRYEGYVCHADKQVTWLRLG